MTVPWERLNEMITYHGFRRKIAQRTYRLPDGRAADFEIRLEPRVVAILALTPEQTVILARQFRPGPEQILTELPGGGIELDEAPEAAARRELLEETGYEGDLRLVGTSWRGAYTTMRQYSFVALNCKKVQPPCLDENEFIEVLEVPLAEFRGLLRAGQLTDVVTGYMGLDFLDLL